ncbi:MAG: DNA-directed RNA polymerase subunit beta, partial [Clostridiales bacterium]|nr:DNA-directed RNA polymerase subunit beta [Clostridiales bacterium]
MTDQKLGQNTRKSFSKTRATLEIPNLIEVQTKSFEWFLNEGFDEVLRDVSPIKDHSGNYEIEFLSHSIDRSLIKYPVEECKERDVNYAAPLKVKVRLHNNSTGEVKETNIVMGDFPLMTENGTFVINGAERVIVSQIIRSPGMYYSSDIDKSGKKIFAGQVIPYRGAWIEYEIDCNDIVWVKIDKNRKLPITMFIRALGMIDSNGEKAELDSLKEICDALGDDPRFKVTLEKDESKLSADNRGTSASVESLREIYRRLRPGDPPQVEAAVTLIKNLFFDPKRYDIAPVGRYKFDKKMGIAARIAGRTLAKDVVDTETGEVLYNAGSYINEEDAREIEMRAINEVEVEVADGRPFKVISNCTCWPEAIIGEDLRDCGVREKVRTDVLRSIIAEAEGDIDAIKAAVRTRIAELCPKNITKEDIFGTINYLLGLAYDIGKVDD